MGIPGGYQKLLQLEMSNIVKRYPGVIACNNISIKLKGGEILGLIGENGAGKSTIMNILYGMIEKDSGTIKLNGKILNIKNPAEALEHKIGMVHQHFMLMPNLTVLQNIILGNIPVNNGFINEKNARIEINKIMKEYNLHVNLDEKIYRLSVGEKQRVEILKALFLKVNILILDEPTAVLTPTETEKLLVVLKKLKEQGVAIVFITHKLKEVLKITDHIVVMRKGQMTGNLDTKDANFDNLSKMMVGRLVNSDLKRNAYQPKDTVLEVKNLFCNNNRGMEILKNISFSVKQNEIVGIAGVEGNGQTELIEVLAGLRKSTSGEVIYLKNKITNYSIRKRREAGIAHIPEDRLKVGTSKTLSIMDNIIANSYYHKPYSKVCILQRNEIYKYSESIKAKYDVKVPDTTYALNTLSGGNMQKVVIGRELDQNPILILSAQPTRGVDIGAIESIHRNLLAERDAGKAILLVSAELDEIFELSDRILVMYEGEIVGEFKRGEIDEYSIAGYMTGAKRNKMEGRND